MSLSFELASAAKKPAVPSSASVTPEAMTAVAL